MSCLTHSGASCILRSHQPGSACRIPSKRTSGIRPEIQALRAVAVSLVLVYHFWPAELRGGYVGVDVFFAISGFLITTQLLREVDRTGRLSMTAFWARRARRILPAALVVLLFCALATVLFVPEIYWRQFFGEMRASTEYAQNWHLAAAAVRYGAADSAPTSLQHFWSLSAEEQFYLVWPILILLAVSVAGLRDVRIRRASMALVMLALVAGSLTYGINRTAADPAAAYFVTPTRAWEFGMGGLVALLPSFETAWPALRSALSWLGLGAIAFAAVTFDAATPFPAAPRCFRSAARSPSCSRARRLTEPRRPLCCGCARSSSSVTSRTRSTCGTGHCWSSRRLPFAGGCTPTPSSSSSCSPSPRHG